MTLTDQYDGSTEPFEGDRTIVWRSLPASVKVTKANVRVSPVAAPGSNLFEELISFNGNQGDFGTTKITRNGFAEVDFHKRRTLAGADGSGVRAVGANPGAHLQVDLGGLYVEINSVGAIKAPNDALFTVPSDGSLPGLTVSKFKLTPSAPATNVDITSVLIRSVPTNVSLRVGSLAPFWTRAGDLPLPDTSTDFSAVLQAFLANATVENGFFSVPLVVHSDTLARLALRINVEFVGQAGLAAGLKEVVVPFDLDTRAKTEDRVLSFDLPQGARVLPGQTAVRVVGAFNDSRIVHGVPPGAPPPDFVVAVSPAESQAQLISVVGPVSATAIDLLLTSVSPSAQLSLDLRSDLGGTPGGASLLGRPVEFTIAAKAGGSPLWISVPLPRELTFSATACWLVLSSLEGKALWSTQPAAAGSLGLQHTLDASFSWHYSGALTTSGPLEGSFRLRNKPAVFEVPIQLRVGTGGQSAPVDLDRFQPLGRLDFTIDTPDLAEAFNEYLSTGVPAACPSGEHLINGDFARWVVSGNNVGEPAEITFLDTAISAVATSPDGRWTYLGATVADGTQGAILTIDSICDETLAGQITLRDMDPILGMAVHPDGTHIYFTTANGLGIADAVNGVELGTRLPAAALTSLFSTQTGSFSSHLLIDPDGGHVYFEFGVEDNNRTVAISTETVEQLVRVPRSLNEDDIRSILMTGGDPTSLAVSPDGSQLYLALTSSNSVTVIDTAAFSVIGNIDVPDRPVGIDFTTDGKLALVATAEDTDAVQIIDTTLQNVAGSIRLSGPPVSVIAAPSGLRAYAVVSVSETESSFVPLDLAHKVTESPMSLQTAGGRMAITPQGDRVYVIAPGDSSVTFVRVGSRSPAEWSVTSAPGSTSAQVMPACFPHPSPVDLVLVFGTAVARRFRPNQTESAVSQVVPVAGPCTYTFSFSSISEDPDAVAEIFWLDQNSSLLRTDTVPIQPQVLRRRVALEERDTDSAVVHVTSRSELQLLLQRQSFTSPAGAASAEVRVTAPAFATLAISGVSLSGSSEEVGNPDFQVLQNGVPEGWTLKPQSTRGVSVSTIPGGIRLFNSSSADAELSQSFKVAGSQQYAFEFKGRAAAAPSSVQQKPTVELHFLAADGTATGAPAELLVSSGDFTRLPATGSIPQNTASVEIHLKTASGTGLEINGVSFQPRRTASVPLTFVSQSAGELRVSRPQVTYDIVPAPPPAVPPKGLPAPTPPGGKPGDLPSHSWCSCCGTMQPITKASLVRTPAGRPVTVGLCPGCGDQLMRAGGRLVGNAPVLHLAVLPPHRPVPRRAPIRVPAPQPESPLTVLKGIREGRVRQLAKIGITSLEQLAAASPETVAKAMTGTTVKQAAQIIRKAGSLLRPVRRPGKKKER